jgi:hypothetical protein
MSTGFSPESVYAAWSDDERVAADRIEEKYNQERRCQLAELVGTSYVRVAPDESLRHLATVYRGELEDIDRAHLCGGAARARVARAKLVDVEREQEARAALADSWLANEDGTHCYTAFVSRGGLDAVLHHGATPPSYHLAAMLDRLNWERGFPHVLAWGSGPADDVRGTDATLVCTSTNTGSVR